MSEEKKEQEEEKKEQEEEKKKDQEQSEEKKDDQDQKNDQEENDDQGYEEGDTVSSAKYNQALRKQREAEAQIKELTNKDEEEDGDEEEKEKESPEESELAVEVKELRAKFDKNEADDRKASRNAFFESHPEYVKDSEKWQGLLDEIDNSFSPDSTDDYFVQLEKAHRIVAGDEIVNAQIVTKQRELATDAAAGGDGAQSGNNEGEFTAEDQAHMKEWNISEDGMRAAKKKIESGSMRIL